MIPSRNTVAVCGWVVLSVGVGGPRGVLAADSATSSSLSAGSSAQVAFFSTTHFKESAVSGEDVYKWLRFGGLDGAYHEDLEILAAAFHLSEVEFKDLRDLKASSWEQTRQWKNIDKRSEMHGPVPATDPFVRKYEAQERRAVKLAGRILKELGKRRAAELVGFLYNMDDIRSGVIRAKYASEQEALGKIEKGWRKGLSRARRPRDIAWWEHYWYGSRRVEANVAFAAYCWEVWVGPRLRHQPADEAQARSRLLSELERIVWSVAP